MRALIDTHVFIWWDGDVKKLSPAVAAAIRNPANELFMSTASIWEMVIKEQSGKLFWNVPLEKKVEEYQKVGLQILSVTPSHVFRLMNLPLHHKDPFDRLIVATAIVENLTLLTNDAQLSNYPLPILW